MKLSRRAGSGLFAIAAMITVASAQRNSDWRQDPYTEGDRTRMQRAGYVSFLPSTWREEVEKALPGARIRWIETEHFILGSSLNAIPMPKPSKPRRRMAKELDGLRRMVPDIKRKQKTIDPWLRLHLYAWRAEHLYEQMLFLLRAMDEDFPKDARSAAPRSDANFMGLGPYLGMRGKYRVLLLENADDLANYQISKMRGVTGKNAGPFHHHDEDAGALMYCTSAEVFREQHDPPHALHCQVRFDITQNLLKGYRHYEFLLPAWIVEGVANGLLREFDPEQFSFSAIRAGGERTAKNARWKVNSRRLVGNGLAPAAARLCVAQNASGFTLNDHICSWSRVDFLRRKGDGRRFARFMRMMKAPHVTTGNRVEFATVLAAQEKAFEASFGMKWTEFDDAWRRFVLKTYPKR